MIMRGGTSKGAYFLRDDLPPQPDARDDLILRIVGSPDPRQIDGIGGGHPLTTKVAVVGPPTRPDCDVDYLFLQPSLTEAAVADTQNCGNILAGVGPFAVERGLVRPPAGADSAEVRIHMVNTAAVAVANFALSVGMPDYRGDTAISGVPGTASAVRLHFLGIAGSSCGALLPTGNTVDTVAGVRATMIDNGMPTVVMRAEDVGITGYEDCATLEANAELRQLLERIRLTAGPLMNLGDVAHATVPKLTMVAPPRSPEAHLCTRTFIPHRCHEAIGVLGAVSVATAAILAETTAAEVLVNPPLADLPVTPSKVAAPTKAPLAHTDQSSGEAAGSPPAGASSEDVLVNLEHPTGVFTASIGVSRHPDEPIEIARAGIVRTTRKLAEAKAFPR